MHLSIVAPVPDAHLSFIDVPAVLAPVCASSLNMMILASCPPSSITREHVRVLVLDGERDRVHLLDELARPSAPRAGPSRSP